MQHNKKLFYIYDASWVKLVVLYKLGIVCYLAFVLSPSKLEEFYNNGVIKSLGLLAIRCFPSVSLT